MDTDHLRLFVMAAERLNISAAGRELGLAPTVASARLAKLETELGVELLRRTGGVGRQGCRCPWHLALCRAQQFRTTAHHAALARFPNPLPRSDAGPAPFGHQF
jgi:hypothetical protein